MGSNMMLTIGAILLFGMFLSLSDKMMIGNTQTASQNEYFVTGLSLAQSLIDEAKNKAFDHTTDTTFIYSRTGLTVPASLGPDGVDEVFSYPDMVSASAPYSVENPGYNSSIKFNDIDDYNGYTRVVNTPRAEGYKLIVSVRYASETYPDSLKNMRTFCKKMVVKVTSPYFPKTDEGGGITVPDTLQLQYAFTY